MQELAVQSSEEQHNQLEFVKEDMTVENYRNLIVVTGAGEFIEGNLVSALHARGYTAIRAVDIKRSEEWYQRFDDVESLSLVLNLKTVKLRPKGLMKFIT